MIAQSTSGLQTRKTSHFSKAGCYRIAMSLNLHNNRVTISVASHVSDELYI